MATASSRGVPMESMTGVCETNRVQGHEMGGSSCSIEAKTVHGHEIVCCRLCQSTKPSMVTKLYVTSVVPSMVTKPSMVTSFLETYDLFVWESNCDT